MDKTDICCCCGKDMPDPKLHCYVQFRYQVPGSGVPEAILVAVVCHECASDADNPTLFPVIELIINSKVIRFEHPDSQFKPE